jgi:hypothetical protein
MTTENDDGFASFVRQRQDDIKRIAKRTRGEYQPAEVQNVAWLLAQDMHSRKGIPIDFLNPDYQERLLSHVYQELVRYRETHVRHAIRLNHGSTDDDENEHPLMHTLVSDDGRDPLAELLVPEAATLTQGVDISYSLAADYAHLLGQFDNNLQAVADFLLISISAVRRRCSHAIWLASDPPRSLGRLSVQVKTLAPVPIPPNSSPARPTIRIPRRIGIKSS